MSAPKYDILLDPDTGDVKLVDGDEVLATGIDAVKQAVLQELSIYRGEWFLDEETGLPMFEQILVTGGNEPTTLAAVQATIRQAVLLAPGVKTVEKFTISYDADTRRISVSLTAKADDGTLLVVDGYQLGGA